MKLFYIDNFRSIAIALIVLNHVISAFNWGSNISIKNLFIVIAENTTVLFIFISGYLFCYLIDRFNYIKYMKGKIKFVLLPYFLCSIPAIIYFVFVQYREGVPDGFYEMSEIFRVLYFYVTGIHLAPYWYIPTIFLYFIFSPVLLILYRKNFLLILLPFLIIISFSIGRLGVINSAIHFMSVYVLGMLCCQYRLEFKQFSESAALYILVFIFILFSYLQYTVDIYSLSLMYSSKVLMSLSALAILQRFYADKLFRFDIAYTSFGIFFLHSYFISVFKLSLDKLFAYELEGGFFQVVLLFIAVVVLSHGVVVAIRKLFPKYSRYLIGS